MIHDQLQLGFFQNLELILQHQQQILHTPQLYYFRLPDWYIGASPVGRIDLYLGDLIYFWEKNPIWFNRSAQVTELIDGWSRGPKVIRDNPKGIRIVNCSGSALSGTNSALGWDEATKTLIKFTSPTVFGLLKSLDQIKQIRPHCERLERLNFQHQTVSNLLQQLQDLA